MHIDIIIINHIITIPVMWFAWIQIFTMIINKTENCYYTKISSFNFSYNYDKLLKKQLRFSTSVNFTI